jgi:hypothetical protein
MISEKSFSAASYSPTTKTVISHLHLTFTLSLKGISITVLDEQDARVKKVKKLSETGDSSSGASDDVGVRIPLLRGIRLKRRGVVSSSSSSTPDASDHND